MNSTESLTAAELPVGTNPPAVDFPHFPTRQQAFVWRNWEMVEPARLARVLGATEEQVLRLAEEMGLAVPPQVSPHWLSSGYITLVRQNWHLLPYEQLLDLLGWTPSQLDFALREDDFLWVKVGLLKPQCEPLRYRPLSEAEQAQTAALKQTVARHFEGRPAPVSPPFEFLEYLQHPEKPERLTAAPISENEVHLDGSWTLTDPRDEGLGRRGTETALNSFVSIHEARWGITLNRSGGAAAARRIEFALDPTSKLPRESHTIAISPEVIRVTAIDSTGWRRALQWLEDTMLQRGGPYLPSGSVERRTRFDLRLSYPYCGVYGDALTDPEADPFPDGLLARLSRLGVNGLWLQGLFSTLYPWPLAPEMSAGWENRLANLRRLTERAAAYGIGLYLYTNEPRGLPLQAFDTNPALAPLKGAVHPALGVASMCSSRPETIAFLREASAHIFRHVPQLGGLFTITRSENPTSCFSHGLNEECPNCRGRGMAEAIGEINTAIAEGAWSSQPAARILAYTWGEGWPVDCIELMPPGVEILTVSEEGVRVDIAGVESSVIDYSMSQIGPGPKAVETWERGRQHGHPTVAKMQINNTWENSAVPWIPVPDLVEEHLTRVEKAGVTGVMLGWTLGGFPAGNQELASHHYWEETASWDTGKPVRRGGEPIDLDAFAARRFGKAAAPDVRAAWKAFSNAFLQFPFSLSTLYGGPQNYGPMNLLHARPTGYSATMLGFPYDDLKGWAAIYPPEAYEQQCRLLSGGWAQGLPLLEQARAKQREAGAGSLPPGAVAALEELERVARAAYLHFRSSYLQAAFVRTRDELAGADDAAAQGELKTALGAILDEEIDLAKQLYDLAGADARIGYEASNHYYYALHDLQEKVLNCENLKRIYD